MKTSTCFSCGGEFRDMQGPVHRYMTSSPGCWATYGEVLAREYGDPSYFSVHRLTIDAYAVQHPGGTDRQSIQSVGLHLVRLCQFLEHGLKAEDANQAMLVADRRKSAFTWLEPPMSMGRITAADVYRAASAEMHRAAVMDWAESAWQAWSRHHDTIRSWLPRPPLKDRSQATRPMIDTCQRTATRHFDARPVSWSWEHRRMQGVILHFAAGTAGALAVFLLFMRLSGASGFSAPFGAVFIGIACAALSHFLSPWATPAIIALYAAASAGEFLHERKARKAARDTESGNR